MSIGLRLCLWICLWLTSSEKIFAFCFYNSIEMLSTYKAPQTSEIFLSNSIELENFCKTRWNFNLIMTQIISVRQKKRVRPTKDEYVFWLCWVCFAHSFEIRPFVKQKQQHRWEPKNIFLSVINNLFGIFAKHFSHFTFMRIILLCTCGQHSFTQKPLQISIRFRVSRE